ncbi:MAG TPA: aldo/keto reductase, partial [Candidatus Nanoarchaeia archaeon]|nr:aldo/keto reductase [Candidatus Nanoarchaeia archaeon]
VQGPPASAPSSTTLPPARVPATAPPPPSPAVHPSTLRSALDHLSSLAGYTSTLHNSGLQFPEDRTFEYSDQQEATAQLQRATNVRTILDHIVSDLSALRGMRKALPVPFAQLLERSAGIMIPELRKLLDDVQLVIDRYVRHVPVPGHVTAADLNRQRRHVQDLFTEFLTQAQTMFGQQISVRAPSLPAAQRVSPQKTIQNMTLTEITAQLDPACTMEGGPFEAYAEVISTKNAGNLIEDAAHADGKIGLILVADGVGGHPAGNVATRAARNAILHFLRANYAQLLRADHDARRTMLNAAVQEGANMIRALIASNSHFTNTDPSTNRTLTMATTLSIGILLPAEGRYFVYGANIGDSRMYVRKKSGEMQQVSSDDGVAANEVRAGRITPDQAEVHPQRHVVTAVLGDQTPAQLEVHQLFNIPVETGDMVVAMSDGVIDNLGKKFIDAVGAAYGAPKEIVHGLLTEAHRIAKNPTDDYERSHAKDDDIAAAAILVPASHPHMSAAAALRPVLGFWKVPAAQTGFVVKEGLQVGYTELDTSDNYDNEEQLAAALHALHATVDVVYTKIDPSHYHEISVRVERAQQLFDGVTRELILMLHWPGPFTRPDGQVVFDAIDGMAAYKALAALVDKPSVSNFGISHLVAILPIKKPYLNQIEINPLLQQSDLIAFCKKYGILVQAYSPLASGKLNGHPVLVSIVNKHRKSEAQILIRYAFQKGADIVNVKSADPVRMRGNLDINDFQLDSGDMAQLDGLGDDAAYPFGTSGNAPAPQVFHPLRTS